MKQKKLKQGIHTFAICAYKESPYLEDCIKSLINQTISGKIIMITSTPNESIEDMAKKYNLPLYINEGEGGIAQDWNFAVSKCDTKYVTIAHQDDIYDSRYLESVLKEVRHRTKPLIAFTDYGEIRNGICVENKGLVAVKRNLLRPLRIRKFQSVKFVRRRVLGFGNAICCPSVTYCMENLEQPIFKVGLLSNLDWEAWERLSKEKGDFVYIPKVLMHHRIHEDSTTSEIIMDDGRRSEDLELFSKFWCRPIALLLTKIYAKSEKYNKTDK